MSEAYELESDEPVFEAPEAEPAKQADLGWLQRALTSNNLAEDLDDAQLHEIGAKVVEEYKIDLRSREAEGWQERYDSALKLALQVKEEKSYPWPKASNVKFPLIATAAIQFNARAYPAVIDGPMIVKGAVKGHVTPEKQDRADRIGKHMSYQLLEEMDDWEEDTDRLLIQLPIVGCAFRKTYFDPLKGYNCSHLISAGDFVVHYKTADLETCPRATHVMRFYPYEVREKMLSGSWLNVELDPEQAADNDDDAPMEFLEQHRLLDLDDDDYPEPYIVTVHRESERVVRIVARFDERGLKMGPNGDVVRIVPDRYFTKYGFIPAPDGSFYDVGFGTLLNPLSLTIDTTINQLMDAGHLANVQGGFIGEQVSIKSGTLRFQPGEWKKANASGSSLKDNIVPMPVKEPSAVLFSLMQFLIEAAKDVTATQDILGGDAGKGTMPVGTVTALIEQGLKTFTAIVKRIHRALKKELGILYRLNGRYLDPQVYFTFQDEQTAVAQQDYAEDDMDVVPVSDPNMATDMQRVMQAQFVMQFMGAPGMNPRAIIERALDAVRVPDKEELFAQEPPPPDPKAMEAEAKAKNEAHKTAISEMKAAAEVEQTKAETEQTRLETMMMGADVAAMIENAVNAAIQRTLQMVGYGEQPPVHQGDVRGMAPQPGQPPVSPVPPGPAGGPGPEMAGGGPNVVGPAMQGPPSGGVGGPGMA